MRGLKVILFLWELVVREVVFLESILLGRIIFIFRGENWIKDKKYLKIILEKRF